MKKFCVLLTLIFINLFIITFADTRAYIDDLYILENPIQNQSTRIPFEAEIELDDEDDYDISDFIYILPKDQKNSGITISQEGLEIKWSNTKRKGNNILTFIDVDTSKKIKGDVEFILKGKFIITDWKKIGKGKKEILLGYIQNIKTKKYENLWLDLKPDDLEVVSAIKVDVAQNMHLGNAISGEALSTQRTSGGYPAIVKIKAAPNSKLKVTIPKKVVIKSNNSKASDLEVNLNFVNEKAKLNGNKLEKNINSDDSGKISDILIGGETAKTTKNHYGKYKGEFTVRVEYQ